MKVDKTEENLAQCRCLECPSYSRVCQLKSARENSFQDTQYLENRQHYEKMFCAFEKSHCIHLDRGCLCDECVVHHLYALRRHEYCLKSGGF